MRSTDITTNKAQTKKDDAPDTHHPFLFFFSVLLFPFFIGFLPDLGKNCQRTVCQQTHEDETLIWIYYVDLTHAASCQDFLDLIQKMAVSCIWIIICHLLRDHKKFQRDQIKSFYRKLMVQNVIDPLAAEPLLAEMFCQNRSGHFFQISHLVDRDTAADDLLQI